jgi:methylphosphotriester-DNA--protein-cysteine methyltransferase
MARWATSASVALAERPFCLALHRFISQTHFNGGGVTQCFRQAAVWLREDDLTVKAAAERAGYPDVYSFSRAFKRALGSPPSRMKNKSTGEAR